MSSPSTSAVYSIGAVGRMLGVPTATLRAWEDRYGIVLPERSEGRQRLYTRDQVEQLAFVLDLMARGASAADAHRVLQSRIDSHDAPVVEQSPDRALILLAERDPFAAELAEHFVRSAGFDVVTVTSVRELTRAFDEHAPDVVVLDLMISGGRGIAACEAAALRGSRVVAISSVEQSEPALAAGAAVFLRKPVEPLRLVSVIRDVLGRSALAGARASVP